MEIGIFLLIGYGIASLLSVERVLEPLKDKMFAWKYFPSFLEDMLSCVVCTSFHVGWILGLFFTPYFFILDGFLLMGAVKVIEKISMM